MAFVIYHRRVKCFIKESGNDFWKRKTKIKYYHWKCHRFQSNLLWVPSHRETEIHPRKPIDWTQTFNIPLLLPPKGSPLGIFIFRFFFSFSRFIFYFVISFFIFFNSFPFLFLSFFSFLFFKKKKERKRENVQNKKLLNFLR